MTGHTHGPPLRGWPARFALLLLLAFTALASSGARLRAQEMDVPVSVQVPLFLKVVTFDRSERVGERLVVAIVYQSGNRASTKAMEDAERLFEGGGSLAGAPVRLVKIDLDTESLTTVLERAGAAVLYVAPLRSVNIGDVARAAREAKTLTVTGVPQYVTLGLAVGVRRIGDKPKLVVNLTQARLEGTDFSAEFLKLAQVIK